jgi:hypothetical protein
MTGRQSWPPGRRSGPPWSAYRAQRRCSARSCSANDRARRARSCSRGALSGLSPAIRTACSAMRSSVSATRPAVSATARASRAARSRAFLAHVARSFESVMEHGYPPIRVITVVVPAADG